MFPPYYSYSLRQDLTAMDGRVLLRRGTAVGMGAVAGVLALRREQRFPALAFQETEIFRDFRKHLQEVNYSRLFRDAKEMAVLQAQIGTLSFPAPLIEEFHEVASLDSYTYRHIFVVTLLSALLARRLGMEEGEVVEVAASALWHDFGKTRLPLQILLSQNYLDEEQYRTLMEHPLLGYFLLVYYRGLTDDLCSRTALRHHEKGDGSGYPCGLHQDDPRIGLVTVVDIYDALISRRSYRQEPFDVRGALDLLWDEAQAGRLQELPVRLLIGLNRAIPPDNYEQMPVHQVKRGRVPNDNRYGPRSKKK